MNLLLLLIGISNILTNPVRGQLNATLYRLMPPLYDFDRYDACLTAENFTTVAPTYCVVYAEIKPNPDNALWQQIHNFSLDFRRHYRHDHLFFGVCLERCIKTLQWQSNDFDGSHKYIPQLRDKEIENFYELVYRDDENVQNARLQYGRVLNVCLNNDFQSKYNLSLETFIEYCERGSEVPSPRKLDFLSTLFVWLCGSIGFLVMFSSIYDFYLKSTQSKNDHFNNYYQIGHSKHVHTILTAFSIRRNYQQIKRAPGTQMGRDLEFLNGIKSNSTFVVVVGHALMFCLLIPIQNAEFIEQSFHNPRMDTLQKCKVIIQLFFCVSGFLFYIQFKQIKSIDQQLSLPKALRIYSQFWFLRYLRLVPSLLLLWFFNSTFLSKSGSGPYWQHLTAPEEQFCRVYWWKIFFFINNSERNKQSCLFHTWYLATDTQLFAFYLVIALLTAKYANLKKQIYAVLLILSCVIPGGVTYFLKLNGSLHISPETYRYLYFKDALDFFESYMPFFMNLSGYLCGILCAEMYFKTKVDKTKIRNNTLWSVILPITFALLFMGLFFFDDIFEKSPLTDSIYAALYRPLWSILFAAGIFGLCHKLGWTAYDYFSLPIFRIMGRISFQSYLWHMIVIRVTIGSRDPVELNNYYVVLFVCAAFVITNILAFLVTLTYEYPITTLIQSIFVATPKDKRGGGDIHLQSEKQMKRS